MTNAMCLENELENHSSKSFDPKIKNINQTRWFMLILSKLNELFLVGTR